MSREVFLQIDLNVHCQEAKGETVDNFKEILSWINNNFFKN